MGSLCVATCGNFLAHGLLDSSAAQNAELETSRSVGTRTLYFGRSRSLIGPVSGIAGTGAGSPMFGRPSDSGASPAAIRSAATAYARRA